MKWNVFYFSTALSDEIYLEIEKNCKSFKPTFSGVGFDRNVGIGLSEYVNVGGVSLAPIPSYPKYSRLMNKKSKFSIGTFYVTVPSLLALPLLKEFCYLRGVKQYIKKAYDPNKANVVVISGLYRSLLRPAKYMRKKYGLKVCAIVPDLPELMTAYRKDYSLIRKFLNRLDVKNSEKYRECIDGFVFLSRFMDDAVNTKKKPAVIVDGLCNIDVFPKGHKNDAQRFILYAGKISSKFGVDKLVQAFLASNIETHKLVLCGDGDYADELHKIAEENDRIQFLGVVPHERVLELEVEADLLVDPRPSDMEIVKMSFPSKIIEYMASGTPVLTTNLPCFSDDYRTFQYRIENDTISGIKCSLEDIFTLDDNARASLGSASKKFIYENKTLSKQCKKILELINEVCK